VSVERENEDACDHGSTLLGLIVAPSLVNANQSTFPAEQKLCQALALKTGGHDATCVTVCFTIRGLRESVTHENER
jgi:hypothetical protein